MNEENVHNCAGFEKKVDMWPAKQKQISVIYVLILKILFSARVG